MENIDSSSAPLEQEATQRNEEPDRRTILKTAALTAAGVVLGAGLADTADAQILPPRDVLNGHVQVVIEEAKITPQSLHIALDEILRYSGCPACGLVGFDLSFLRGNPPFDRLRQLSGVHSAGLIRNDTALR